MNFATNLPEGIRFALLGSGKTGGKVAELLPADSLAVFNRDHPPTAERLSQCHLAISFLPGEAFNPLIPLLLELKLPAVVGGTGSPLPDGLDADLRRMACGWVWGHNFSLGMALVRRMLEVLGRAPDLFPESSATIREVHHKDKRDAPSGTALSWREWVAPLEVEISSERRADVVGDHRLDLRTPHETIEVRHQALDRSVFAAGALWAAGRLPEAGPGLHRFEELVWDASSLAATPTLE